MIGSAIDCSTPLECWELFFTEELLEKIVSHTNQKLKELRVEYARDRDCVDTSVEEIRALFGFLYLGG